MDRRYRPDGTRMRYFLPGGERQAATLFLVGASRYILLTSTLLARYGLLQIAASFPPFHAEAAC